MTAEKAREMLIEEECRNLAIIIGDYLESLTALAMSSHQ